MSRAEHQRQLMDAAHGEVFRLTGFASRFTTSPSRWGSIPTNRALGMTIMKLLAVPISAIAKEYRVTVQAATKHMQRYHTDTFVQTASSEAIQTILPRFENTLYAQSVSIEAIKAAVCETLWVDPAELTTASQAFPACAARGLITKVARDFTPLSYPKIALHVSQSGSHTTAISAQRRVEALIRDQRTITIRGAEVLIGFVLQSILAKLEAGPKRGAA